ncbi:MAG: ERF family protein [Bacteroidota bacterium]
MKHSESIKEICAALVKAQAAFPKIGKTAINAFKGNKYSPLDEIMTAVKPVLADCGLCVIQWPEREGDWLLVTTRVQHVSGEFFEASFPMQVVKTGPQDMAILTSYGRRYGVCCLLGLAPVGEDHDGEIQTAPGRQSEAPAAAAPVRQAVKQPPSAVKLRSLLLGQRVSPESARQLLVGLGVPPPVPETPEGKIDFSAIPEEFRLKAIQSLEYAAEAAAKGETK